LAGLIISRLIVFSDISRNNTKVVIQIGDSEARGGFLTMRPADLSYLGVLGKPESEVAPGRSCVPKLRPLILPGMPTTPLDAAAADLEPKPP
jgi:hypothetical protein